MTIHDIIAPLAAYAAPELAEGYDNSGLLTGQPQWNCNQALLTLDVTTEVVKNTNA